MEQLYEVIVIGAGISGIGASKTLSQNKVSHIVLESRDRYGGRIYPNKFAGTTVDIGATFIHNPCEGNQICKFIQEECCQTIDACNEDEYYYQGTGMLEDDVIERVNELYDEAYQSADEKAGQTEQDISLAEAFEDFIQEELDGQEPQIRDTVLWKLKIQGNVEGAELSELSAKKQSISEKKNDILVCGGGYPMIFQRLYNKYKPAIRFNTKVLAIDYSGQVIHLKTTNGVYSAKRVISSLPLGILQAAKVQFVPQLPQPYQTAIKSIGNGNQNKLFVLFRKPFWTATSGYINFVTKSKYNRYPIAFIYPNDDGKHILLVFVAGKAGFEIGEWSDQQIGNDFKQFLTKFVDPSDIEVEDAKMSRWHKDEHSLGSYCFNKVGTKKEHFQQFRKPIQDRIWFIGEHTHPTLNSYAHGAYQTGLWAAKEVVHCLQGGSVSKEEELEEDDE